MPRMSDADKQPDTRTDFHPSLPRWILVPALGVTFLWGWLDDLVRR